MGLETCIYNVTYCVTSLLLYTSRFRFRCGADITEDVASQGVAEFTKKEIKLIDALKISIDLILEFFKIKSIDLILEFFLIKSIDLILEFF